MQERLESCQRLESTSGLFAPPYTTLHHFPSLPTITSPSLSLLHPPSICTYRAQRMVNHSVGTTPLTSSYESPSRCLGGCPSSWSAWKLLVTTFASIELTSGVAVLQDSWVHRNVRRFGGECLRDVWNILS